MYPRKYSSERPDGTDGWVSVLSSKSSRETLEGANEYTDIKFIIQEEPTTIILPVDSSDHSEHCLQFYIRYIHKIGNKVCVLYVSEDYVKMHTDDETKDPGTKKGCSSCCAPKRASRRSTMVVRKVGASPGILKELEHEDKMKCHSFKRKVKKWCRTNGVLFEFHRLVSNDVPRTIVKFTKQMKGNMVVMGARRLSGFKSTFMASVSQKVIVLSECPVMLVQLPTHSGRSSQTLIN